MKLLEEFWYSNIEPTEYDTNACKEYKKVLRLIPRNEEKLQASMTDAQKELFSRYTDAVREYQTMSGYLLFKNSFKLGARIMLEVIEKNQQLNEMKAISRAVGRCSAELLVFCAHLL